VAGFRPSFKSLRHATDRTANGSNLAQGVESHVEKMWRMRAHGGGDRFPVGCDPTGV
jgi:hypothetical protein